MADPLRLEVVGPRVLLGAGLALLLLALYMVGADSLACRRTGTRVDCRVARSRLLGLLTVEQANVPDVIDAWVRTTSSSSTTYRAGRGSQIEHTSSNDTLMLHTRDDQDIAALGGEGSARDADQVVALVKAGTAAERPARAANSLQVTAGEEPVTLEIVDSYLPVALFCGGLGLVLAIFGAVALRAARGT